MKAFRLLLCIVALTTVAACDHLTGTPLVYYSAQGEQCSTTTPYPGCNYFSNGAKANIYFDPYYGLVDYTPGRGYCDNRYGSECDFYDYYWYSPSGIWYDSSGYAINHQAGDRGRDVIGDVAVEEEASLQLTAKHFAQKFALASDRALEIVKSLRKWEHMTRGRGRTEADYADLASRVAGVNSADALAAIRSARAGELSAMEVLNDQMAQFWGTDAETTREVLRTWITQ